MLPVSLQIPAAVLGLVLLTLIMSWVLKRYQVHQALRRKTLQGLEKKVLHVSQAMDAVKHVPLPRELRVLLRSEILAYHQAIAGMLPSYPNIDQLTAESKSRLNAEGPESGSEPPVMADAIALAKTTNALDALIKLISSGLLTRLSPQDIHKISQDIGERRAKVTFRYYVDEARRLEAGGQKDKARSLIYKLMSILGRKGPNTALILDYYKQAEELIKRYSRIDSGDGLA